MLNIDRAARDAGLDHSTGENYARLLEAVFLSGLSMSLPGKVDQAFAACFPPQNRPAGGQAAGFMPVLGRKAGSGEAGGRRKWPRTDTSPRTPTSPAVKWITHFPDPSAARLGKDTEITRHSDPEGARPGRWRDDGAIFAFEVKASGRVPADDLKPLRKLRTATGDAFVAGIALYAGSRSHSVEDRLYVMPVDRLWSG